MCDSCGCGVFEYPSATEEELSLAEKLVIDNIKLMIAGGMILTRKKRPYNAADEWKGLPFQALDQFTRLLHGVQVLPDVDTAGLLLDQARDIAVTYCDCAWMSPLLGTEKQKIMRCIALNQLARAELVHGTARIIDKHEAMDIIIDWRSRGAYQTAGWVFGRGLAFWICNCDLMCTGHRAAELKWAVVPSFLQVSFDEDLCINCGDCAGWCTYDRAMKFDPEKGIPVIDTALCKGCGLCRDNCPTGALHLVPRTDLRVVPGRQEIHIELKSD